jgi:hypothetical protein
MQITHERPAVYGVLACLACFCGVALFHGLRYIGSTNRSMTLGLLTLVVYLAGMGPSLILSVVSLVRRERPRTYGLASLVCSVCWLFVSLKWIFEQLDELDKMSG